MAVNDVYRARVCVYTDTQIGLNTLYFRETITGDPVDPLLSLANALDAAFETPLKAWMSPKARYRGVEVRLVDPTLGLPFPATTNDGPGVTGLVNIPQQVSGVVSYYTAIVNKSGRGRSYIPFPNDTSSNDEGYINNAGLALLQAVLTPYIANYVIPGFSMPSTYEPVHRRSAGTPGVFLYDTIILSEARKRFGTQRRRGQYGRQNVPPF